MMKNKTLDKVLMLPHRFISGIRSGKRLIMERVASQYTDLEGENLQELDQDLSGYDYRKTKDWDFQKLINPPGRLNPGERF